MRADARGAAFALATAAALASLGFAAFALLRLRAFGRRMAAADAVRDERAHAPRVTVLKPLHGASPDLAENLRSFCRQDYGRYEIVFGVHDAGDEALPAARAATATYPDRASVVIGDGRHPFRNPKIANLAAMLPAATGEIIVIADADMRVDPAYLRTIVAPFADASVGAVTALYRGCAASSGIASALGAMWISEQFAPSALVAAAVEPLAYCFGATMAIRREVLDAVGGLAALGNHLADDHVLGRLVRDHGLRVVLAPYVVENRVHEPGLRALVAHEVRWARTIRTVRPASYPGILLTYPLPLALLSLALARRRRRLLPLVALAAAVRLAVHLLAPRALGAPASARTIPLIPLRDALGVLVYVLGLRGRGVRWHDARLRTEPGGTIAAG